MPSIKGALKNRTMTKNASVGNECSNHSNKIIAWAIPYMKASTK